MATIKTKFTIGDEIQFLDNDGRIQTETVVMIECQVIKDSVWIRYGYGEWMVLGGIDWVSQHKILMDQEKITPHE
jgi:hypothetical protein